MVEKDGKFYGRGASDDKGPILAWVNVIEAFQKTGNELPINIKFCLEGMEESGSVNLAPSILLSHSNSNDPTQSILTQSILLSHSN